MAEPVAQAVALAVTMALSRKPRASSPHKALPSATSADLAMTARKGWKSRP